MDYFIGNDDKCIKRQLCENKEKAQSVLQMQPNSSVDVRLSDMNELYSIEKRDCINYSLGVAIVSILILNKIYVYFK
jgi:hypothetical protein